MERILKALKRFLEDSKGNNSSKRLILFITGLSYNMSMVGVTLFFLIKSEYSSVIEVLESYKWALIAMGGFVASEHLKKK